MLRSLLLFVLITVLLPLAAQTEKKVDSQIKAVTLYQQGATVERQAGLSLSPGTTRLVFSGITDRIDTRSIQVEATGDLTIIAVSSRFDFLRSREREAEVLKLEGRLKEIRREIRMLEARMQVLVHEKDMILANRQIGGQQEGLDIDELKYAARFFRERLTNIDTNYVDAERKVEVLNGEIGRLNQQLGSLGGEKEGSVCEVVVDVTSGVQTRADFRIRYMVPEASWTPVYDLRVISTDEPIRVDFRSRIRQNSGEDWKQARIILSTGDPSRSHTKPELNSWDLSALAGFREPLGAGYAMDDQGAPGQWFPVVSGTVLDASTGQPLPYASVVLEHPSQAGTVTDASGNFRIASVPQDVSYLRVSFVGYQQVLVPITSAYLQIRMQPSAMQLEAVEIAGAASRPRYALLNRGKAEAPPAPARTMGSTQKRQLTTMTFELDEPFSVPSDGKEYTLPVSTFSMPANYELAAVPRLDKDAFLMARVSGWEEYSLLSGTVNLYYQGNYVGRSQFSTEETGDELNLSLGRDAGIVVSREKLKEYSSRQLIGSQKKTEMAWKISLRNTKDHKVKVKLEDQVPVSRDERITVELLDISGAEHDEARGFLRWDLELAPGEVKEVMVRYAVKYPKSSSVSVF